MKQKFFLQKVRIYFANGHARIQTAGILGYLGEDRVISRWEIKTTITTIAPL